MLLLRISPAPYSAAPEEVAVQWLIEETDYMTEPSPVDEFRLTQLYALLSLYFSTDGEDWLENGEWLLNEDECTWYGITCSRVNLGGGVGVQDVVTEIDLTRTSASSEDNNLEGSIPADIGLLENLETLAFYHQPGLSGNVPSSLETLTKMVVFSIGGCSFSGALPEGIGGWTDLKEFWV